MSEQNRRIPPCETCGGIQVGNLNMVSPSSYQIGLHPIGRMHGWSGVTRRLNAVVCLGCGLVKLFASDLDRLRQMAHEHPDRFAW